MDWDWIWKAVLIIVVGTLILRIAGRKSISQMTLAQTVIMIGIGSLLIQPVAGKNVWTTFGVGAVLVLTLVVIEYGQVKMNWFEKFITGQSVSIIKNGQLDEKNLKKLRFTVDQLEMKLRQQNVSTISDLKSATLEPNGQVGYELMENKKPATKQDIEDMKKEILSLKNALGSNVGMQESPKSTGNDIFKEVEDKGRNQNPPQQLQ
ncbi:DUF421 domain-containing protein [Halobacillus shinanisalinarum]|uniref:DUF421 domain-containing protein n=1 Tax=Halobacillus shinanisalinarum TaxID=2932258 RepID=A0ABY4GWE0_9BACI|nr:DUF421 domain-containing protein [Halobacillus shinanisalinarum]UOQ92485.1 DUF421 domain-containing protein [Halobacillus shinanisalinarum]